MSIPASTKKLRRKPPSAGPSRRMPQWLIQKYQHEMLVCRYEHSGRGGREREGSAAAHALSTMGDHVRAACRQRRARCSALKLCSLSRALNAGIAMRGGGAVGGRKKVCRQCTAAAQCCCAPRRSCLGAGVERLAVSLCSSCAHETAEQRLARWRCSSLLSTGRSTMSC